jgi:hypothetical protein
MATVTDVSEMHVTPILRMYMMLPESPERRKCFPHPHGAKIQKLKRQKSEPALKFSFQYSVASMRNFVLTKFIPWSRVLFEKPPVAQLLKNIPTFYETRGFINVFTKALHFSLS